MMVLTTETLPPGCQLVETYGVLLYTARVEVSEKGVLRNMFERKRNEWEEALQGLQATANREANVIYGLQVSTSVGQFNNGSFLFVTFTGTAGRFETE